jgi:hypothetical protein
MEPNGWNTFSDAIKIGLPAIITALAVYGASRATRAHDFEKQRRQRKQDLLERVADEYGSFQSKLELAVSLTLTWNAPGPIPKEAHDIIGTDLIRAREDANEAQRLLSTFQSRLNLSGFSDCAQKLQEFDLQITVFKRLLKSEPGDMHEKLRGPLQFLRAKGQEFEGLIQKRYSEL